MSKEYWQINSGMPNGETYDRWVYWARTEEKAQECLGVIREAIAQDDEGGYLFGPHMRKVENEHERTKHWNGHELVDAPRWGSIGSYNEFIPAFCRSFWDKQ